jgi:beta-fructofuranosidase
MELDRWSAEEARPRLHFTARHGWINDPHTLVHHDGVYHLFFQSVPDSVEWRSSCHWGHATSPDLLCWTEHPPVLAPGDGDDGCWSGSLVTEPAPTIFYTSITEPERDQGSIRVAVPEESGWNHWVKGPTVVTAPDDPPVAFFRDPYLRREGLRWRMIVGAALTDGSAAVLSYLSDDLESWSSDGVLASRASSETEGVWTGTGWECPALLSVDGHDVLLVSVWDSHETHHEAYSVGSLVEGRFVGGGWRRLTYGAYYAGAAFTGADGRPGLMHWLREVADPEAGWAGAHSVPHRVAVEDDRLVVRPHDVVDALRREAREIVPGDSAPLDLPVDLEWTPDPAGGRLVSSELGLELSASGTHLSLTMAERQCRLGWEPGETVRLIIDGPVVEVFTRAGLAAAQLTAAGPPRLHMSGAGTLRMWRVPAPDD